MTALQHFENWCDIEWQYEKKDMIDFATYVKNQTYLELFAVISNTIKEYEKTAKFGNQIRINELKKVLKYLENNK